MTTTLDRLTVLTASNDDSDYADLCVEVTALIPVLREYESAANNYDLVYNRPAFGRLLVAERALLTALRRRVTVASR